MAKRTEIYCLPVLEARGSRSKCQQRRVLSRAVRNRSDLSPWLVGRHLLPVYFHCFTFSSLFLCLCAQISPFHKDSSLIGLGLILTISFSLDCFYTVPISTRTSTFWKSASSERANRWVKRTYHWWSDRTPHRRGHHIPGSEAGVEKQGDTDSWVHFPWYCLNKSSWVLASHILCLPYFPSFLCLSSFCSPFSLSVQFSSVQSCPTLRPHESQHARPPCPSPTPGVYSNSCPSSRWCHPAMSSFAIPFSSCRQSFPASGSFPVSQLFAWGGQSIGVSASASVLPMNTQDWSPSGWTGWVSLQSKGLSRVFSSTIVQRHLRHSTFFTVQLSHPYVTTWPLDWPLLAK